MTFNAIQTVGDVAAAHPQALRVFQAYGIDFCCGGRQPLEEACLQAGVSVEKLLGEIELEEPAGPAAKDGSWSEQPLPALIDHILATYHRPLDTEMPRLEALAHKVLAAHGEKDPVRLADIVDTYLTLKQELEQHMAKEEQILFPWIRSGRGASAGPPIRVMQMEHDSAAHLLERLRELTGGYTAPAEACPTWRALYEGLEAFEADLKQHMHLENNILFPRALQGA